MALLGTISSSSVVPNTAISGTITSSQIGTGALTANSFPSYPTELDLRGKSIFSRNWAASPVYGANRWILWWPIATDGAYFIGHFAAMNYTGPSVYHIYIQQGYYGSTSLQRFAVTRLSGSADISWRRVTYGGTQYLATYNSGETNREFYWTGFPNLASSFVPVMVSSVTTDHETYGTP